MTTVCCDVGLEFDGGVGIGGGGVGMGMVGWGMVVMGAEGVWQ